MCGSPASFSIFLCRFILRLFPGAETFPSLHWQEQCTTLGITMYKITLADGTVLKNLELNGNNYIAEGVIDDAVFKDNLATVTITDGKTTETYEDMVLLSHRVDGGRSWIVLGEKSAQEKAMERINAMLSSAADSITDVQLALAEVYEMMLGGN